MHFHDLFTSSVIKSQNFDFHSYDNSSDSIYSLKKLSSPLSCTRDIPSPQTLYWWRVKDKQGVSGRCAALGHMNPQLCWLQLYTVHIMKGYIFLYLMMYLHFRLMGNYINYAFLTDFFFTFIF